MSIYYKSLEVDRPPFLGGGKWILENLSDITVIFGRNSVGKSILLRNILNQDKITRHYASPERSGEIHVDPVLAQSELLPESRASRRNKNLAPTYRQEVVSRLQAFLAKRGALNTKEIPLPPSELVTIISNLLPQFKFEITGGSPPYKLLRQEEENQTAVTSTEQLCSGETEIFTLALDLATICAIWKLDNQKERILLLDEPDLHLHPESQQNLSRFLVSIMSEFSVQIVIATHSTTLLSSLGFHGEEKTSVIYLNNAVENQKAVKFDKIHQELATCLGGHALMGPLFSYPLLLVEGEDDFIIWSHACRFGQLKFAVIPCNGEEIEDYARLLKKIFSSLIEKPKKALIYKLRDRDKKRGQLTASQDKYVKSLTLNCREIENLYLTDEILTKINLSWEKAKRKIEKKSEKYGEKTERLKDLINQDRRDVDLKDLMRELVSILDPKLVDWKIRISRYLGTNIPKGQIKDFLGSDVVVSLWESEN